MVSVVPSELTFQSTTHSGTFSCLQFDNGDDTSDHIILDVLTHIENTNYVL